MLIKNNVIFSSTAAADGSWIDISNLVSLSLQVTNLEGTVWIELSNDPNVQWDGPNVVAAPSAPVLSYAPYPNSGIGLTGQGTYYVELTYITKNGETVASAESSLAVPDNNVLTIAAPGIDPAGLAIGYNVYIGKTSGSETLVTGPAYVPAYVVDSTPGYHYTSQTALQVNKSYSLPWGYQPQGFPAPPVSSTAGGPGVGINPLVMSGNTTGNLTGITPENYTTIAVFADSSNGGEAMWSPSSMNYKWIRVRKTGATTKQTTAYICGANG
jgi:hypothetical protein